MRTRLTAAEDHNISGGQTARHNRTLAQQPDLVGFFNMDRSGTTNRDAFQAMAQALQNMQDSPLAETLVQQLMEESAMGDHSTSKGMPQEYLDSLDRVPRKQLKPSDECAICATSYLEDTHPLVVRLPCNGRHHFDLECIGPWLKLHSTCPMCRQDLQAKKQAPVAEDSEEEWDDTYG